MSYSQIVSKAPWAWNQWGCNSAVSLVLKSLGAKDDSQARCASRLLCWPGAPFTAVFGLWRKELCFPFLDLSAPKREMVIFTKSACSMSQEDFLGNSVFFSWSFSLFKTIVIGAIVHCLPEPGRWKIASVENKSASGETPHKLIYFLLQSSSMMNSSTVDV